MDMKIPNTDIIEHNFTGKYKSPPANVIGNVWRALWRILGLCKNKKVLRDGYVCESELQNSLSNHKHQTETGWISFSVRLMHQSPYFTTKGATWTLSGLSGLTQLRTILYIETITVQVRGSVVGRGITLQAGFGSRWGHCIFLPAALLPWGRLSL
jgi:hypothetical protein